MKSARILVTGGTGFLGQYVVHELESAGEEPVAISRRTGHDLRNPVVALSAVLSVKPKAIVHVAGVVAGISANMALPATFFHDNLLMGMNVVEAAAKAEAHLTVVSTASAYPERATPPFKEESFWDGFPHEANAPYAVAKKALLVMCQAYRKEHGLKFAYLVPTNLYGPCQNFHEGVSHVVPALIKKFVDARDKNLKEVTCWGTGKATRSFLFVHDAAKAVAAAAVAGFDEDGPVNLPGDSEISVQDLAVLVAKVTGFKGKISWDASKPDGQPRRALDGSKAERLMGWKPKVKLEDGLRATVDWYLSEGRAS